MERCIEMRGGGRLTLRQEGPRVQLEAERPEDGQGLYKAWLRGSRGGKLLLGTLAPEQGRLRLRRVLSLDAMERAGCWPDFWAETLLAFPFSSDCGSEGWYCEQHPDHLLSDPVLKLQAQHPMLCRRSGDGFLLAAPFRTDAPVALPGLFCLARVERWSGRSHLVWRFNQNGQPQLPHNGGTDGTD